MAVDHILLIRHGETAWNAERRWQGMIHHVPLNDSGLQQAHALAAYLAGQPIGAIYSSDLLRAWETAAIIGDAVGVKPQSDVRLREVNAGRFQGLNHEEVQAQMAEELAEMRKGDPHYRFPGGESWSEVSTRLNEAFQDIARTATGPQVIIMSHGGSIRHLLGRMFPDDPALDKLALPNTSITTLTCDGERWQIVEAGATPHLRQGTDDSRGHTNGRWV